MQATTNPTKRFRRDFCGEVEGHQACPKVCVIVRSSHRRPHFRAGATGDPDVAPMLNGRRQRTPRVRREGFELPNHARLITRFPFASFAVGLPPTQLFQSWFDSAGSSSVGAGARPPFRGLKAATALQQEGGSVSRSTDPFVTASNSQSPRRGLAHRVYTATPAGTRAPPT